MRDSLLHPAILAGVAVNAALFVLSLAIAGSSVAVFTELSREDGFLEWLQFLSFCSLACLLAFVAVERWAEQGRLRIDIVVIAALAALVGVAALEEVSWFQRVLRIETLEFFQRHNRQRETNLHNLVVGDVNLHKEVLVKIIFGAGLTHNLALPLLSRRWPSVRTKVEALGLYLPPLSAACVYLSLLALSELLLGHARRGEVSEALGAVHYLSTSFAAYVAGVGYARPMFVHRPSATRLSVMFALFLVFLLLVAWLLAVGFMPRP